MSSFIYSVDGISLADAQGRWWVTANGSAHSPAVALRSVGANVPGMSGIPDVGYEPREAADLPLRVMVASRNAGTREAYWEAVKALFAQGVPFVLGRAVDGVERTTLAKLKSIGEPELNARFGSLVGVITVTILDGLFHGEVRDVSRALTSPASQLAIPHLSGTAPCEDWQVQFRGPLTSATVTDGVTGTGIGISGGLAAGQFITVRGASARRSATADAGWLGQGVDVSGQVVIPPAGLLRLTPRPVATDPLIRQSRWSVTAAGASGAAQVTLRARPAYA
jgi:hypothetical protein